jgi:hypothetical protein
VPGATEEIIGRLILAGQRQFSRGAQEAAKDIKGIGTTAKTSSEQANKSFGGIRFPNWKSAAKGIGKYAAGAGALYAAKRGLTSSIAGTEELAKGTLRLQRTTGMDAKTASQWAEITRVRGVRAESFQRGLVALSRNMVAANQGNKQARQGFDQLGVSMDNVRKGNTQAVMMQMADGFSKMENPALKAALAQKFLARQGQELLPLFNSGSAAIQEQMDTAAKYGAVIGEGGVEHTKNFVQQQREMKMAMDGLKVSIGTALMPIILSLAQVVTHLSSTFQPLLRSGTAVKIMIGLLIASFIALKALNMATQIQTGAKAMAGLARTVRIAAAAQWLFNAAMTANPIGLIILALVALGVAFVVLYKKVGWFRNAVNAALGAVKNAAVAVFNWIKGHWPLLVAILTGPFGVAVYAIIKHFDKIKAAAKSAINFIIGGWNSLHFRIPGFDPPGPGPKFGGINIGVPHIPMLGQGGIATAPGSALVGDTGPEIVQLPRGAQVAPLPAIQSMSAVISVPVYLDRRQIALAHASYNEDVAARQGRAS